MSTAAINWLIWSLVLVLIVLTVVISQLDARYGYRQKLGWIWEQQIKASPWWGKSLVVVRLVSGITAAGLFLASLTINICTWVYTGIARQHWLGWLHIAVLAVAFVAFSFQQKRRRQKLPRPDLPGWTKPIVFALAIYMFALFAFEMVYSFRSQREKHRGTSYQTSYGQVQLEKKAEKEDLQSDLQTLRFFSGLWMMFSLVSAVQLLWLESERYKGPFGKYNDVVKQL